MPTTIADVAALATEARRRRHGVHADTCSRIREMIIGGDLPSGTRINEKELCDALSVSRTPIREALKVLAAEGLVELLPNRGSRVTSPSPREIRNLFAVIASLERLAAEIVTREATAEQLARLRTMHDAMLIHFARGEREQYFQLNHRTHETIIELADNLELSRTHADLMTRARRPRFIAITSDARWAESVKEHALIIAAMELGDGRYVGEILFRHVLKTGDAYITALADAESTGSTPK